MRMKQDCSECRRLERRLEKAAIDHLAEIQHGHSLDDSDPEKVWAKMSLRSAAEAETEAQNLFNEHLAKHAPEEVREVTLV